MVFGANVLMGQRGHCQVVPGGGQFKLEITDTEQNHFASISHTKNRKLILSFYLEKDSRPRATF